MKLDKYVLLWEQAQRKVCKRLEIPVPNHHQQAVLMLLRRGGQMRFSMLKQSLNRIGKNADPSYVAQSLSALLKSGLIAKDGIYYSLSSLGREYLSYLRNYLINYRL